MKNLLIIKLGGSVISDKSKPYSAKRQVIQRLGKEILTSNYQGRLILVHGSGSFGHTAAVAYRDSSDFPIVADAARKINEIVVDELLKVKLPVVAFAPLSFILAENRKTKACFLEPLAQSLRQGFVPCLYGDVVMDKKGGLCIYSGEKIISLLVDYFYRQYQIEVEYITATNGVLDKNGKVIAKIGQVDLNRLKKSIFAAKATDVTGGMLHKVEEGLSLVRRYNIVVRIGRTMILV